MFYSDTRQELPPIQFAAEQIMAKLRLRNWIRVVTVRAPLDKRFMVYFLGRGVPPPNNNTLRWCTPQIKVEPMAGAERSAAGRTRQSADAHRRPPRRERHSRRPHCYVLFEGRRGMRAGLVSAGASGCEGHQGPPRHIGPASSLARLLDLGLAQDLRADA
ncbi:hypothetical protein [Novosphingobium sp. YAF33]|uniref:hypothetical protein n=1 Tax=Novosphingobium sp. YAF33 TaxID=3233082 RepID=UPI003F9A8FCA